MSDKAVLVINKTFTKPIYDIVKKQYKNVSNNVLKFESGEREKCQQMFVRVKEAMGLKYEEDFPIMLKMFEQYVEKSSKAWVQWKHALPSNYIGFLNSRDNINIFVKGKEASENNSNHNDKTYTIAGTGGRADW